MQTSLGKVSEGVYGRVYVAGCSDGDKTCDDIIAQVGYGAYGKNNPITKPDSYSWGNAVFNGHYGNNDEYTIKLKAPSAVGVYSYLYRFSGDGGSTWSYCGLGDAGPLSSKTVTLSKLGRWQVTK
jgi:hypothetical protein